MKLNFSSINKTLFLITAFSFLSFSGCSKKQITEHKQVSEDEKSVTIMATFYPLYIMLMNITQDVSNVKLNLMAPSNTGCLHDYQLTTKDMKALEKCDILVANGQGMEDFLDKALKIKKDYTIIACKDYEIIENNPHVWVSPEGAVFMVNSITQGLCQMDPENSEQYKINASVYTQKIQKLNIEMHNKLDKYAGSAIITFHEAFPYFAKEYNLNLIAVIEREAGTEPNARELKELIEFIKEKQKTNKNIVLAAEPQYSSNSAKIIADETGLNITILDPCVTGKMEKDAYLEAMYANIQSLETMLEKSL